MARGGLAPASSGSLTDDYAGTSDADDLREPMQKATDHMLRLCGANVINLPTRDRAA
jgi:hypothetical protein